MTGIFIRGGVPTADLLAPKTYTKLNFDYAALCGALAAGHITAVTPAKIQLFDACLRAFQTRPAAESWKGKGYKPGARGVSAATRFGLDVWDVYQNFGGTAGIRSLVFYGFARECADIVGIEIPPANNFGMYLYRATRP